MKGLAAIPSSDELAEAYARLQAAPARIGLDDLALWSQWSRLDPRLAEQWVAHVALHWREIPSGGLNQRILALPWPAAAAALLAQAGCFAIRPRAERAAFRPWARSAAIGVLPAPYEQFFVGNRAFAGAQMLDDARLSITPFARWGYFAREILVNKAAPQGTCLSPAKRRQALDELIAGLRRSGRERLRVEDYREALEGRVGLRQAEKDLAAHPGLRAMGRTRARYYRMRGRRD